jgi:hypothetical protein
MLTWGHFVFDDLLRRDSVVLTSYWAIALVFVTLCLVCAFREIICIQRATRKRQRQLVEKYRLRDDSMTSVTSNHPPDAAVDCATPRH